VGGRREGGREGGLGGRSVISCIRKVPGRWEEGGREEGRGGGREKRREGGAAYLLHVILAGVLELSRTPCQEAGTLWEGRKGGREGGRGGRDDNMRENGGRGKGGVGGWEGGREDVPRALAIWESLSWMAYILEMGCPKALRSLEYLTAHWREGGREGGRGGGEIGTQ